MEQCKVKILWIDDDIDRIRLKPYLDEFEDNGFEIVKVANPDNIDCIIASNKDIQCIILDISMPVGKSIHAIESQKGMRTGLLVLQKFNQNTNLSPIKKVVFTIANDVEVCNYCESNNIPYLLKQEYLADTFVKEIKKCLTIKKVWNSVK
jgi:CheY-like chemotaxis protein